jgi:hypothetical protein
MFWAGMEVTVAQVRRIGHSLTSSLVTSNRRSGPTRSAGAGHHVAMATMTISLDDQLMAELAQVAHDEHTTEADLVREGIERLLHSRLTGPSVPRFARRLGPLAIPERLTEP